jgi:hypothetical protein
MYFFLITVIFPIQNQYKSYLIKNCMPLGWVGCTHAQPEVAQYPTKRHPYGLPWKIWERDRKCPWGAL